MNRYLSLQNHDLEPLDQRSTFLGLFFALVMAMQSPLRSAGSPEGPSASVSLIIALFLGLAILLSQTVFIVPAGNVAVVTTLGKVTGSPRNPGANIKAPLVQNTSLFDVRTQVRPEQFSTLTKDLQVIQATATVKYAMKPAEARRSSGKTPPCTMPNCICRCPQRAWVSSNALRPRSAHRWVSFMEVST